MKKIILSASVILLVACSKKQVDTISPSEKSSVQIESAQARPIGETVKMRMYWTVLEDCDVPARNCFPDIIINSLNTQYVSEFESAIAEGSIAISIFFKNGNGLSLFDYLSSPEGLESYNKLISGNYYITKLVNSSEESVYLVKLNGSTSEDFVMILK